MATELSSKRRATVYVVDGDAAVQDGLNALLGALDVAVSACASAEALLTRLPLQPPCCLIVEAHLPGMGGLELMAELRAQGIYIPTIVLARHSDVSTAVQAMRNGALDFIDKPFVDRILLARVREALAAHL